MKILTELARAWLTRSFRTFRFEPEYDERLPYPACDNLGLYVHIPFCRSLCDFCPYCKVRHSPELCDRYVDALIREIHLAGDRHPGKKEATSVYFGGGTPALALPRIGEILRALERHFRITEGVGVELHPDDVTPGVLRALRGAGVSKISIGIQSFQKRHQDFLGRKPVDREALRSALAEVPFETVSMDFIFALPGQTAGDLQADVDEAFSLGANHVAVYPFIAFTFAKNRARPMNGSEKRRLMDAVTAHCLRRGCVRTSVWTFSGAASASYSSMTRENFLGFGCSAATLLRDQFKINTFDIGAYCARIDGEKLPTALTLRFTERQRMLYWLFWEAYSTEVNAADFERFFGVPLERMYGTELRLARKLGFVTEHDGVYRMTPRGAFYFHYYENFYTLAYIDKMWGLMRDEAFPAGMEL